MSKAWRYPKEHKEHNATELKRESKEITRSLKCLSAQKAGALEVMQAFHTAEQNDTVSPALLYSNRFNS